MNIIIADYYMIKNYIKKLATNYYGSTNVAEKIIKKEEEKEM